MRLFLRFFVSILRFLILTIYTLQDIMILDSKELVIRQRGVAHGNAVPRGVSTVV